MRIDYQEVVRRLVTEEIIQKPSHGQRDLLAAIARLERACEVEDEYERFVGLFTEELTEAFFTALPPSSGVPRPLRDGVAPPPGMPESTQPSGQDPGGGQDASRRRRPNGRARSLAGSAR